MGFLRVGAQVGCTLAGGVIFAIPGALFLLGHTVMASTGSGTFGSWTLQTLLLLGGFCGGCGLGFWGFRWLKRPRPPR